MVETWTSQCVCISTQVMWIFGYDFQQCDGILPLFHPYVLANSSFLGLARPRHCTVVLDQFACCYFNCWFLVHCTHLLFAMFFASRVGEAKNPGPSSGAIKIASVNPTTVHQKVGKIMHLGADVISLSETSATHAVQSQVNNDLCGSGFRAFWSASVSAKKFSADNRPSLRGEALGSAILTHSPSRKPRSGFTDLLWETQRISMAIIRLGGHEILFVSVYGMVLQTGIVRVSDPMTFFWPV